MSSINVSDMPRFTSRSLLRGGLLQHPARHGDERLIRANPRQPELRRELQVLARRHPAYGREVQEQLAPERAPHLPAHLRGRSARHNARPLLRRQHLGPLYQLLEASDRRPLCTPSVLWARGIPNPHGHF